ncbi:GNAT family N-acetyltransferase [Streptomyces alkaliterrae]|uniref:GNAT family N-acetyltransferase n=1 Tax=Streptomyces alkaliterrae TaxID=2213162 RepID=A0A5P0YUR4_9ACTN|nr:GNAT family N-acetyltransferase [Streptomyces alkaliterrae]MQS04038.1 GNAT family N-acetyltransferase [Streptomyces alkaliterrae]
MYKRQAEEADGPALAVLDRETWSPLHAVTPPPEPPHPPFFEGRQDPAEFLVAEVPDLPGPVAYLKLAPPTPLASNSHVLQVQGLAVAVAARGRGVARALLRAAAERARARGARRVTLRVLAPNAPARALYAAEGYVEEGVQREEFRIDGRYVDDVLMALDLTRQS